MKKYFVLFFILAISCVFILPCYADFGSTFLGQQNLLSTSHTTNVYFNDTSEPLEPMYYVTLEGDTDYTFISSTGVDRLLVAPVVDNYSNGHGYVSSDKSLNWYFGQTNSTKVSGTLDSGNYNVALIYRVYQTGTYYLAFDFEFGHSLGISISTYDGEMHYLYNYNYRKGNISPKSITVDSLTTEGYCDVYIILTDYNNTGDVSFNIYDIWFSDVPEPSSGYQPGWADSFYVEGTLNTFTFHTEEGASGVYAVGFLDSDVSSSTLFSRQMSEDNTIYLVQGSYTYLDVFDSIYSDGYDSGYDSGYSVGQTDGLNSSNTFPRLIYTILSAPFVIISNTLNFEILGLNILNLVKVVLTILIIAFLFTKLKGRE